MFGYEEHSRESRTFAEIFQAQNGGCGRIETYCMSGVINIKKRPDIHRPLLKAKI